MRARGPKTGPVASEGPTPGGPASAAENIMAASQLGPRARTPRRHIPAPRSRGPASPSLRGPKGRAAATSQPTRRARTRAESGAGRGQQEGQNGRIIRQTRRGPERAKRTPGMGGRGVRRSLLAVNQPSNRSETVI